jgi:hypothetical protein
MESCRNPEGPQNVSQAAHQQRHGAHPRFNGGKAGDVSTDHAEAHGAGLTGGRCHL